MDPFQFLQNIFGNLFGGGGLLGNLFPNSRNRRTAGRSPAKLKQALGGPLAPSTGLKPARRRPKQQIRVSPITGPQKKTQPAFSKLVKQAESC